MSSGVNGESRAREMAAVPPGSWRVVPELSRIEFRVRKMGLYFVKGRFRRVSGSVKVGPDGVPTAGSLRIDASSVSTRMPPRDWHLRTRDFLSARQYPEITVTVDDVAPAVSGAITVSATVMVRDARARVRFNAHWHAAERGTDGPAMLHASGLVDRRQLGVRPRRPVDWIVGREVHLEARLLLQPA